jgi:hypothetical protein
MECRKMKNALMISTLFGVIAGCGGGGGGDTPVSTAPVVVERLAAYIGSWSSACAGHEIDSSTLVRTPGTTDSINITNKSEYYAGANCTGTILGTSTDSAIFTAKYVATVNSSVIFTTGSAAVPTTLDQVTASRTQGVQTVSGPGVVRTVKNGQPQWCIDFGGGNSTCIMDMGTQPAQSGASGGLLLQGNNMFVLSPSGSVYTIDSKLTKK